MDTKVAFLTGNSQPCNCWPAVVPILQGQPKMVTENTRGGKASEERGPKKRVENAINGPVLHLIIISALDLVSHFHLVNFLSFIFVPPPLKKSSASIRCFTSIRRGIGERTYNNRLTFQGSLKPHHLPPVWLFLMSGDTARTQTSTYINQPDPIPPPPQPVWVQF